MQYYHTTESHTNNITEDEEPCAFIIILSLLHANLLLIYILMMKILHKTSYKSSNLRRFLVSSQSHKSCINSSAKTFHEPTNTHSRLESKQIIKGIRTSHNHFRKSIYLRIFWIEWLILMENQTEPMRITTNIIAEQPFFLFG